MSAVCYPISHDQHIWTVSASAKMRLQIVIQKEMTTTMLQDTVVWRARLSTKALPEGQIHMFKDAGMIAVCYPISNDQHVWTVSASAACLRDVGLDVRAGPSKTQHPTDAPQQEGGKSAAQHANGTDLSVSEVRACLGPWCKVLVVFLLHARSSEGQTFLSALLGTKYSLSVHSVALALRSHKSTCQVCENSLRFQSAPAIVSWPICRAI